MKIKIVIIFIAGFLIATGLAIWQYSLAPEGMLLYTPVPETTPSYTASSAVGFLLGAIVLCALSVVVSLISLFYGMVINRKYLPVAKHAGILAIAFGFLVVFTLATETLWP